MIDKVNALGIKCLAESFIKESCWKYAWKSLTFLLCLTLIDGSTSFHPYLKYTMMFAAAFSMLHSLWNLRKFYRSLRGWRKFKNICVHTSEDSNGKIIQSLAPTDEDLFEEVSDDQ